MATAYNPDNLFARILRGEIPSTRVYEDDYALAFEDIHPQAPCHVLLIPKGAYIDLQDFSARASESELVGYWRALSHLIEQQGFYKAGFRALANTGKDAHQEVPHFHLHLLAGESLGPIRARRESKEG